MWCEGALCAVAPNGRRFSIGRRVGRVLSVAMLIGVTACAGSETSSTPATTTQATTTTQTPAPTTTTAAPVSFEPVAALEHTALVVSDFEVSEAFYTELLGFEEVPAPWLPTNQMFLTAGDGVQLHMGEVPGIEIRPSSFNHMAFSVPDFDGFLEHLQDQGVVYSHLGGAVPNGIVERPDGVRQTYFQDPDGYWLEVNDVPTGGFEPVAALEHTALVVSDFEVSEAFYTELLGFEEVPAPWLPTNQMFLTAGDGVQLHMGEVPGIEIRPSSFNHMAFSVPDFDGFLEHLQDQGVVYSHLGGAVPNGIVERPDGVRQTYFQDPDGYWLEVNDAR